MLAMSQLFGQRGRWWSHRPGLQFATWVATCAPKWPVGTQILGDCAGTQTARAPKLSLSLSPTSLRLIVNVPKVGVNTPAILVINSILGSLLEKKHPKRYSFFEQDSRHYQQDAQWLPTVIIVKRNT